MITFKVVPSKVSKPCMMAVCMEMACLIVFGPPHRFEALLFACSAPMLVACIVEELELYFRWLSQGAGLQLG